MVTSSGYAAVPKYPQKITSMRWLWQEKDERLLQRCSTFTKSVMVFVGVYKLVWMVQNRPGFYRC